MLDIVLHQWEISPFCQKVARALRFKGLDFKVINYNGVMGAKVPLLSKAGKVPVLDINGKRIQDSTHIVRYLDEAFPDLPRLYPLNPLEKVYAELWEDWADELLYFYEVHFRVNDKEALKEAIRIISIGRPAYETIILKPMLEGTLKLQLKMQGIGRMGAEAIEHEFSLHLDRIELVLAHNSWLVGDSQTIADIAVGSQLAEVIRTNKRVGQQILNRPYIAKWLDQL